MNEDPIEISWELKKSFNQDTMRRIRQQRFDKKGNEFVMSAIDLAATSLPILKFFKASPIFQVYSSWKMEQKILEFFEAFAKEDYNQEDLDKMAEDIENMNGETLFEHMMDTFNRIDNHHKARLLAELLHSSISGKISRENFLRHSWILSNVPYIDLQQLHLYTKDYYQSGSSEVLLSNGLIRETIINPGGASGNGESKYGLSTLGEELQRYGFHDSNCKYQGKGRQVSGMITSVSLENSQYPLFDDEPLGVSQ